MKIGIIDDEKPARSELHYLMNKLIPDAIITEMESGEDALEVFTKKSFDLLFIDINLGDINGTTLATTVRKLMPEVEIVFATAYNNYAEKAFEVDALHYLLKPFSEIKVKQMLEKYNNKHFSSNLIDNLNYVELDNSNKLFTKIPINIDKKIIFIDISSIIYIEVQNRVCVIHTKNKDYTDNSTLTQFEERLSKNGFFRIQKSFLINIKYIVEIFPWFNNSYCVKMQGFENEPLPISRNQIKNLKNLLQI